MSMHDKVTAAILETALRQVATTKQGKAIIAAGLEAELLKLVQQIAANASYGVCELFGVED